MPNKRPVKRDSDVDFEILFFEGVLKQNPDFIEALIALGDLYTKKGLIDKGLEVDEKLSRLRPEDPLVFYNLACSYSLVKEVEKSIEAIKTAINNGYGDFDYLEQDKDLDNIRQDERFQQCLSRLKPQKPNP